MPNYNRRRRNYTRRAPYGGIQKKRYTRRRRTPKYNRYNRAARTTYGVLRSGYPEILWTKLKYFENSYTFSFDTTETIKQQAIGMNCPHDPYLGIGGKSALYYQAYHQIYKYSRVYAAKIEIVLNKLLDVNQGVILALVPDWFDFGYTSIDNVISQPQCKSIKVLANRVGDSALLSYYITIPDHLQIQKNQFDAQLPGSGLDGTGTTNPQIIAGMKIILARQSDTGTLIAISGEYSVKIIFYTKFSQRYPYVEQGTSVEQTELAEGEIAKQETEGPWNMDGGQPFVTL